MIERVVGERNIGLVKSNVAEKFEPLVHGL